MRDLCNNIHVARVLSPAAAVTDNTAQAGQIIDRKGYDSLCYVIQAGGLADADVTVTALLEHGDDSGLSDAVAVPDAMLNGTEALAGLTYADDNEPRKLGYVGDKRYTRLTLTPANNSGNLFLSVTAVLGHPQSAPTANAPI